MLNIEERLTHPDIEESKTVVASVLSIEVLHAHFVHPNIVGLTKLQSGDCVSGPCKQEAGAIIESYWLASRPDSE